MAYIVHHNLKSIDVKYCKVIRTPSKASIPIFTKNKKSNELKDILISTSKLTIPWSKTLSNDETTFNIEFCNHDSNYIESLEAFLNEIIRNSNAFLNRTIQHDQIKVYPNQAKSLRFFNVKKRDISVYNEFGAHIPLESILKNDIVKILFHINSIYYRDKDENKISIEMKLQQIMQLSPNRVVNLKNELIDKDMIPLPPPPPPPMTLQSKIPKIQKMPKANDDDNNNNNNKNPLASISLNDLIAAKLKLKTTSNLI